MTDRIELAPLAKMASNALAAAAGDVLALWPAAQRRPLPRTLTSVTHLAEHEEGHTYDTVASVGQLGVAVDLEALIARIRTAMTAESVLVFCEPTIASDQPTTSPPHDVTTSLWRAGLTVFECRRERRRVRLRTAEYCWGRARLTPDYAPPRRWAEGA
ncbi:MAG: hypothetical protein AAF480_08590 [Actinomycetota bacterium]